MRVDNRSTRLLTEPESIGLALEQPVHKLLEQETSLRDFVSTRKAELAIVVYEHRVTRRLQKHDRHIAV
ncbi:hypothetical protein D3C83_262460 [compost metagenome]